MSTVIEFLRNLHSADGIQTLLRAGGLITLTGIVFAETGLLAGFFLPGDSLLVAAGIFASGDGLGGPPIFHLWTLLSCVTAAAVLGDQLNFYLGRHAGKAIYRRPDSLLFKKKHLHAAEEFYREHGGRALIIARFVPVFRTFVPFAAGMAHMKYKRFVGFSVSGGVLWVWTLIPMGYFLGQTPLANQLHKVLLVVIFVSVLPIFYQISKSYRARRRAAKS